jgi:hypothetical protein
MTAEERKTAEEEAAMYLFCFEWHEGDVTAAHESIAANGGPGGAAGGCAHVVAIWQHLWEF